MQLYDRALLLHGAKRNQVLTLAEVEQYGLDSFADADYEALMADRQVARDASVIVFVAPPWGAALDETNGLDLRATQPPITHIVDWFGRKFADHAILFAIQVYEKVSPDSLTKVQGLMDWSELCIYDINVPGRNHGILLGARGPKT